MHSLSNLIVALLATAITIDAKPLRHKNKNIEFQPVHPVNPEFSIKVPSQLFIEFCQNANFGAPCDGGNVAPGLCYYAPFSGVSAVWPSQEISGCTLYKSSDCDASDSDLMDVAYPGIPNLTSYGFNDQVNSFICY